MIKYIIFGGIVVCMSLVIFFQKSVIFEVETTTIEIQNIESPTQPIVSATFLYDIEIPNEVVNQNDFVFVGKVTKHLYTTTDMDKTILPLTYYEVELLDNIKGEIERKIVLCNFGGYAEDGYLYMLEENTLPIVDEIYIFIVSQKPDGSFLIEHEFQKVQISILNKNSILENNMVKLYSTIQSNQLKEKEKGDLN